MKFNLSGIETRIKEIERQLKRYSANRGKMNQEQIQDEKELCWELQDLQRLQASIKE